MTERRPLALPSWSSRQLMVFAGCAMALNLAGIAVVLLLIQRYG